MFGYYVTLYLLMAVVQYSWYSSSFESAVAMGVTRIPITKDTFRAAVFEYPPSVSLDIIGETPSRQDALEVILKHLKVYEEQASKAAEQNVDIIVFPEDGIYNFGVGRDSIQPYLEYIPNPHYEKWNPCLEPGRYENTEAQQRLSCISRMYNMYVVANIGDIKYCTPGRFMVGNHLCPYDGRWQYNTNVAYGPDGAFLARYHKQNLFKEPQFDEPLYVNYAYFDAPFGRIGMFTCFDILFFEPAINLVKEFGVDTVAFPTAWMDELPLLSAIGYHSGFARGMNVNFLSANRHFPLMKFGGSGIYTPNGAAVVFLNASQENGKLLIATVPSRANVNHTSQQPNPSSRTYNSEPCANKTMFTSDVFHDSFNFGWINPNSSCASVCQGDVCCHATYNIKFPAANGNTSTMERYAIGAFDGLHTHDGQYYLQVCVILKCESDVSFTCGKAVHTASTIFTYLKLVADTETRYIVPEVLVSKDMGIALPNDKWTYHNNTITSSQGFQDPLIVAALVGRLNNSNSVHTTSMLHLIMLLPFLRLLVVFCSQF